MRLHSLPTNTPATGLVLGAGGIRGCAHAGVVEVLAEARVQIDLVVGASIGSMYGLAVAAGLPADYIARVGREASPLDIFRFYAGRLRATRSNPIARMLLEAGDGKTFADLPIPFAVVVTNMATGGREVIDSGPILPAVQASIALPFIARPVVHNGNFYLDGGISEPAPIGVAHQMGADRVIAICLGLTYPAPDYLRRRPWTRLLLERAGAQRKPIAGNIRDQIRFSCRICVNAFDPPVPDAEGTRGADVAIWPEFNGLSPNSVFGAAFCYRQGRDATLEALPEIQRMLSRCEQAS
jgi:NTE family protein